MSRAVSRGLASAQQPTRTCWRCRSISLRRSCSAACDASPARAAACGGGTRSVTFSVLHFSSATVGLAVGSSWSSPSCIWASMSPCRTWLLGAVSVCRASGDSVDRYAPDWVCEVLSPSTERYDRGDKRLIYAEAGVGHLWHVDPVLRMLEVFELTRRQVAAARRVPSTIAQVAAAPFADLTFSLGLLWPFGCPRRSAMMQRVEQSSTLTAPATAARSGRRCTRPSRRPSCRCAAASARFCTRHGAMTVSRSGGRATFEIERAALTQYQFGTRTGTSLICGRCGMYAGVILEDGGKAWSVLNVRGLAIPEFKGRVGRAGGLRGRDAGGSASRAASRNGRRRRSCGDDA